MLMPSNGVPHTSSAASEAGSTSTAAPTTSAGGTSDRGHETATAATSAATSSHSPIQSQASFFTAGSSSGGGAVGGTANQPGADALLQHVYQNGFCNAQWHDCILHFHSVNGFTRMFHLHTLLLARSPYLRQLLMSTHRREIGLQLDDPHITEDAISICLGHLYGGPSSSLITPENALAVLAAAFYLQLDELCQAAHAICKQSITADNVQSYIAFSRATTQHPRLSSFSTTSSPAFGDVNNSSASHSPNGSIASSSTAPPRYGAYSEDLNRTTTEFLARALPVETGAFSVPPVPGAQERLIGIYSTLDFDLFKSIAQHPSFPARSTQELFNFSKKCVAARKKRLGTALGEEQVVLAFAGQGGGAVQVLRKPPKKLSKIGPHALANK
ncbi:hypothetical protein K437DRAFT_258863 [Tilletiaria anomala UBC 951]|uniref:BTB domain-containing protein n=1 Tax=Tilletiaria anomala (strain ATCC 24038 / CBS 436.72 / UBC 951) TaxID=1037660 RepID=A0A066VMZ2_TILAU|nr:uncharacterized protein K437DRAFT_258863 [Tilletiaria anomala UBC 951]KDN39925.1 hypothetical protein K437DRAFT_258863 [Tilletiaria anomala UBC 951]